jgi:hypothetical protein
MPEHVGGDITGLHGQHMHAVPAVQLLGRERERGNIAFVPIENHELPGAMLGSGRTGLHRQPHIGLGRERERAFIGHMHGGHAERACGEHEPIHALRHRMRDHIGGECVGSGRQMGAMLLDAAGGEDHERIALELGSDLGLRQIPEITARQHGALLC